MSGPGQGVFGPGGVWSRGCLLWGVSASGGLLLRCLLLGCLVWRMCGLDGGVCSGGCLVSGPGGVWSGGYLVLGVSILGGVCSRGVCLVWGMSALEGVWSQVEFATSGGVCSGGVSALMGLL